jgi:putative membrane-bound dehydrogenase-like protein
MLWRSSNTRAMKPQSSLRLLSATLSLLGGLLSPAIHAADPQPFDPKLLEFVKGFQGRGTVGDFSIPPRSPQDTVKSFKLREGLVAEVVAAEPVVRQPLNLHFDERGRLWVVQYIQYPFFAGLKVVKYDEHLRAVFDKIPPPPPYHTPGADKITILEDKDGDGTFESHKDFVTGLNIATSVCTGRGGVWVLNAPYLLFYPDRNRDDLPDGPPEVHLSGFGLQDTHSVATSLHWGPDGWLYGANGSTTTGEVKGVKWLGQCIWRYQPRTGEFEIFAEGGGNTMSLEFDSLGRCLSGTNHGSTRGMHYAQGGAGIKNWGKHGPLINPYSFGWFEHMAHTGYQPRFAQSMIVYEGGAIPSLEGTLVAAMSLTQRVMASRIEPDTSTFKTVDLEPPLIDSADKWFRPVDTRTGPDGAIYLADWYDTRLTHVDPRDNWDRDHGRIYRLQAPGAKPVKPFDLAKLTNEELVKVLSHPNKWHRQTAQRIIADRRDRSSAPLFKAIVEREKGQLALEALWAVNHCGGLDEEFALKTIGHENPFVRYWTVRLLGDAKAVSPAVQQKLASLARGEGNGEVRSQLASSAKRIPASDALPVIRELVLRSEDVDDKHIPLLLWWAIESKAVSGRSQLLDLLKESPLWNAPMMRKHIVSRLGQRYTAERTEENLKTAATLLALAPSPEDVDLLVKGMEAGLQGDMVKAVPAELQKKVDDVWAQRPHTPVVMSFAARLGHPAATEAAVQSLTNPRTAASDRRQLMTLVAERRVASAIPALLDILRKEKADAIRTDALNALQRFDDPQIARTMLELYPALSAKLRATAQGILFSRVEWARLLLEAVDQGAIKPEQINAASLLTVQGYNDARANELVKKHWGRLKQSGEEKERRIAEVRRVLAGGKGDAKAGAEMFTLLCATCHTLNGKGGKIAPDLTGYERDNLDFMLPAVIDPSLGIREEYTGFTLNTKDGQSLTGFVADQNERSVTLLDLAGNRVSIAREQIESLQASHTSLMPEGLLDALDAKQVRDLFAYVMGK